MKDVTKGGYKKKTLRKQNLSLHIMFKNEVS